MCCTRSSVALSRSMYSSSTPSVYAPPSPKRWSRTLDSSSGDNRVHLDLEQPARIDERVHGHGRVHGPDVAEDLCVRPRHLVEVGGRRDEDARAHDVLEPCAELLQRGTDDLEAAAGLAVGVRRGIGVAGHGRRGAGHVYVLADAD